MLLHRHAILYPMSLLLSAPARERQLRMVLLVPPLLVADQHSLLPLFLFGWEYRLGKFRGFLKFSARAPASGRDDSPARMFGGLLMPLLSAARLLARGHTLRLRFFLRAPDRAAGDVFF